jgi:hypothetical protein
MLSSMNRRRLVSLPGLFSLWGMAALGLALSACAVPPDQGHVVDGVVMVAPPAPKVEVMPAPPQPDYVWIGGYWNWVGGRHTWVSGHWTTPRPGHHWVAYEWVRQGDGWRLRPGHWVRG